MSRTFSTHIDLPKDTRAKLISLLNQQLADTSDLYSQTKQAHWNIKGMDFIALHKLFDELAENLEEATDEIAERITALGGFALGTVRMAAGASCIPEFPSDLKDSRAYMEALVERYGNYAQTTRAAIEASASAGDQSTADLFTEISRSVDKHLWFLEAHLQD